MDDAVFQMQEKPLQAEILLISAFIYPPRFIDLVIAEPDQPHPMAFPVPLTRAHLFNWSNV